MIEIPAWPDAHPRSTAWEVRVDGRPVPVLRCERGDFALWTADGPGTVEAIAAAPPAEVHLRPRRLGLRAEVDGRRVAVRLSGPARLLAEVPGQPQLYLFAEPAPAPAPAGARVLAAGAWHAPGPVRLAEGQTLWIERGAVLNARIDARGAGIRIGGGGLITGAGLPRRRHLLLDECPGIRLDDLTITDPGGWTVVLGASDGAALADLRILTPGSGAGTDGIDLVGSSRVRVRRCFVVAGDDAVVVKAFSPAARGNPPGEWARPVDDVLVEDCTLGAYGGQAMEIGHELTVDHVQDVAFRGIDVLFAHQFGSPFGIHAGDRAAVRRVRYERVQIEHCYHQIMDLRVMRSRFNRDTERGSISDVSFTDIDWWTTPYNAGYTLGAIAGFDAGHRVADVRFVRFRRDGMPVASADDLDLLFRHADGVSFATA